MFRHEFQMTVSQFRDYHSLNWADVKVTMGILSYFSSEWSSNPVLSQQSIYSNATNITEPPIVFASPSHFVQTRLISSHSIEYLALYSSPSQFKLGHYRHPLVSVVHTPSYAYDTAYKTRNPVFHIEDKPAVRQCDVLWPGDALRSWDGGRSWSTSDTRTVEGGIRKVEMKRCHSRQGANLYYMSVSQQFFFYHKPWLTG